MTGTMLEEGLRGAGGHPAQRRGRALHAHYDPQAERATRDIVSRAMYRRCGRATSRRTAASTSPWRTSARRRSARLQGHGRALRRLRLRPRRRPGRGGADRALHDGRRRVRPDCTTALPGPVRRGRGRGGVHGANRLGGNGVANSTVFGGIAGDTMAAWVRSASSATEPISKLRSPSSTRSARSSRLRAFPTPTAPSISPGTTGST
jgi:fumarate reductase flavoprotein subunit